MSPTSHLLQTTCNFSALPKKLYNYRSLTVIFSVSWSFLIQHILPACSQRFQEDILFLDSLHRMLQILYIYIRGSFIEGKKGRRKTRGLRAQAVELLAVPPLTNMGTRTNRHVSPTVFTVFWAAFTYIMSVRVCHLFCSVIVTYMPSPTVHSHFLVLKMCCHKCLWAVSENIITGCCKRKEKDNYIQICLARRRKL